jgi:hypothetical protein
MIADPRARLAVVGLDWRASGGIRPHVLWVALAISPAPTQGLDERLSLNRGRTALDTAYFDPRSVKYFRGRAPVSSFQPARSAAGYN